MATVRVFHDGTLTDPQLDHPEGIAVHPDGSIWCGGEAGQLYRIDPDGATLEVVATTGGFILGVSLTPGGDVLYACDLKARAVHRLHVATRVVEVFSTGGDRPFVTPNAIAVAADGTVYVSDSGAQGEPAPGVYRFAPDGTGGLWYPHDLDFANGLALTPSGRDLYVAETFASAITRIAIDADGGPGRAERVAHLPGVLPDGVAVGPDGAVYVGCYEPSQVLRVDPAAGSVTTVAADRTAHLLCHPTNVAFRGADLFTSNLGRWHVSLIERVVDLGPPSA
ncbi:SMP-30/gluconolactonase/LRE family protein [Occultella glacieicola]|uniref:SMP-30/gluconolactonase/LRE family protein n=1 Tax=Occultella glacieicola TaxID=2518684 RepID=A0ABY2E637_9MICO|nr:SMP-30/gluconolactonase/LRE family protein [Occultella glacieicola]TDE96063.1 SMP-30/gluconolactonase/LRE family protein [Occultella glacieicola]